MLEKIPPIYVLIVALVALALLGSAAAMAQADGPPPAPVVVTPAVQTVLAPVTWYPGTVISRNDSRLSAEEEGRLVMVADVGTMVETGDIVAQLDGALLRQELAEDEAEVSRELARLEFLERDVKRLQKLAIGNNVAENQLDEAISNRAVTRSELAAARARVAFTKERLRRVTIRAPFAGVVTARLMQAGEWAESGSEIIRLVDSLSVEVQTWVPVTSLAFVASGSELRMRTKSDEEMGTVRAIVPVGDDRSRLYELRVTVPRGKWVAGQTLRIAIPTANKRSVVAIPRDALVLRRTGTTVFRILEDDSAQGVTVTTGIAAGDLIEVSGIEAGDRVVVRGGERMRTGQNVLITETLGQP